VIPNTSYNEAMRVLLAGLLVTGLAAVLGCGKSVSGEFARVAAELPTVEAEAKRLGVPLTGTELMPQTPIPTNENAVLIVAEAVLEYAKVERQLGKWQDALTTSVASPSNANRKRADDILRKLAPILRKATEAAAKPKAWFNRDWNRDDLWNETFPELAGIRDLTRGLAMRGKVRAARGDVRGALSDFRSAFAMGRIAASDPSLISGLVSIACDAIVTRQMEWAVSARPNDIAFLTALGKLAANEASRPPDLMSHLRGEVLFALAAARRPEALLDAELSGLDGPDEQLRREVIPRGVPKDMLAKAYRVRILQVWNTVFADRAAKRNPVTLTTAIARAQEKYGEKGDPTTALNRHVFPVFDQAGMAYVKRQSLLLAFKGFIDVLRFMARKGRFPTSLAEAGSTSLDPLSGKPFVLKITGNQVRVYGPGVDGVDDGGSATKDVVSEFPLIANPR